MRICQKFGYGGFLKDFTDYGSIKKMKFAVKMKFFFFLIAFTFMDLNSFLRWNDWKKYLLYHIAVQILWIENSFYH